MNRTPLYDAHVAAGARMVEFAGWDMPVQYSSVLEEHRAVRERVGLFDVSHMGELYIEGPDAEAACLKLFANDAAMLKPGRAQYSLIPNETGGLVDDVIVYRLADDRFMVCLNASNSDKDVAWIKGHATGFDCTLTDRSVETALLAVQGPAAEPLVEKLVPGSAALKRFGCLEVTRGGADILVARTGYTGEDGFELFVPADAAVNLWDELMSEGKAVGIEAIGLGARDTLRLEAGLPLYGHELGEDVSPFEAGLAWVVKLNRPQMVGYSALEAASAAPARKLLGLKCERGIAREGCSVLASGAPIGVVTSGTHSPTLGGPVAMALVDAGADLGDQTDIAVDVRGKPRPASVTALPFYVRPKAS